MGINMNKINTATEKHQLRSNTQPSSKEPVTLTITCKNCGIEHSYTKAGKGRKKLHCSKGCAAEYRDKQPSTKAARNKRLKAYNAKFPERQWQSATKSSAKKRGLDFHLSVPWFKQRLQKGLCELTGLPFKSNAGSLTGRRNFYSPSIDRIDNSIGYLPSNTRMVIWGVNLSKNKFSDKDVEALALSLVLAHTSKACHADLLSLLPTSLIATLPSGHANAVY